MSIEDKRQYMVKSVSKKKKKPKQKPTSLKNVYRAQRWKLPPDLREQWLSVPGKMRG